MLNSPRKTINNNQEMNNKNSKIDQIPETKYLKMIYEMRHL